MRNCDNYCFSLSFSLQHIFHYYYYYYCYYSFFLFIYSIRTRLLSNTDTHVALGPRTRAAPTTPETWIETRRGKKKKREDEPQRSS